MQEQQGCMCTIAIENRAVYAAAVGSSDSPSVNCSQNSVE